MRAQSVDVRNLSLISFSCASRESKRLRLIPGPLRKKAPDQVHSSAQANAGAERRDRIRAERPSICRSTICLPSRTSSPVVETQMNVLQLGEVKTSCVSDLRQEHQGGQSKTPPFPRERQSNQTRVERRRFDSNGLLVSTRPHAMEVKSAAAIIKVLADEAWQREPVCMGHHGFRHILQSAALLAPAVAKIPIFARRQRETRVEPAHFPKRFGRHGEVVGGEKLRVLLVRVVVVVNKVNQQLTGRRINVVVKRVDRASSNRSPGVLAKLSPNCLNHAPSGAQSSSVKARYWPCP